MTTEIALTERGVELKTLTHVKEYVALIKAAGLLPRNMSVEQATIAILHGRELGVSPLQAVQGIGIINGKPGAFGDLFMGLIQPAIEDMEEFFEGTPYQDNYTAVCRIKRRGQSWHEKRFSVGMAKQAKLWGKAGPWTEYPDRQLQMRARGFAGRDRCADLLKGLISFEEAADYPTNSKPPEKTEYLVKSSRPLDHKQPPTAKNSPPLKPPPPPESLEEAIQKPREAVRVAPGSAPRGPNDPPALEDFPPGLGPDSVVYDLEQMATAAETEDELKACQRALDNSRKTIGEAEFKRIWHWIFDKWKLQGFKTVKKVAAPIPPAPSPDADVPF